MAEGRTPRAERRGASPSPQTSTYETDDLSCEGSKKSCLELHCERNLKQFCNGHLPCSCSLALYKFHPSLAKTHR